MTTSSVASEPIQVAVYAPEVIIHAGLSTYLSLQATLAVVPWSRPLEAEVLVVVADLAESNVATLLRAIVRESSVRVVLVADHLAELDLWCAAECRVTAVLPRGSTTVADLADTILAVAARRSVSSVEPAARLAEQIRRIQRDQPVPIHLTSRELDILRLVAIGAETEDIARQLGYSQRTVKQVLQKAMSRLNLRNRTHAMAYAMRAGLI